MPTPPPRPARRRGVGGPLVIVVLVLALLGAFVFMVQSRSSGVTTLVQKSVYDDECENFATMALTEALRALRRTANVPGSPAFTLLRETAPPADHLVAAGDLPTLARDLGALQGYSLVGGGVQVRLLRRSLLALEAAERTGYEATGVVRLVAEVRGPRSSRARLVHEYGLRSVLVAPPRPFDALTFFLANPAGLLTKGAYEGDANRTIAMAVLRNAGYRKGYRELATALQDLARRVETLADDLASKAIGGRPDVGPLRDAAARYRKEATAYSSAADAWPAPAWEIDTSPTEGRAARLHLFAWPIAVGSRADSLDLSRLDLPGLVGPLVEEVTTREPDLERARAALQQALEQRPGDVGAARAQLEAVERAGKQFRTHVDAMVPQLDAILGHYKAFQDLLTEYGGDDLKVISERLRRFAWQEWVNKSTYIFDGVDAARAARLFLGLRPNPAGVVLVRDPHETLRLDLQGVQGRLMIVCLSDVVVDRIDVEDPARDAVVLYAMGDLEVQGPMEAAVISTHGRYRPRGDDQLGSLVLDRVHPSDPTDLIFQGTLTRQAAILSGPDPGHPRPPPAPEAIHLALGPRPLYRRLER